MKINYVSNMDNETTVNNIISAIDWEKCDMLLTLNADAQKKQT